MNIRRSILAVVAAALILSAGLGTSNAQEVTEQGSAFPRQVLLIRHAEKTYEAGDVKLSKVGTQRAEAIPQLFLRSRQRPDPFSTPDFIFATHNTSKSRRPLDTVLPLAAKLKLAVNRDFERAPNKANEPKAEEKGIASLRDEVLGKSKYFGKTILICWHHSTLPEMARAFKATQAPAKWEDKVFDRVWQISYDASGKTTFLDRPQRLLPGDSEK